MQGVWVQSLVRTAHSVVKKKNLILKKYKWTYVQNRNRPTDIENKFTVTKGESWRGEMKFGINTHTLLYI